MTARVDLHISPDADYAHALTFSGDVNLPDSGWQVRVESRAGRPLLDLDVDTSDALTDQRLTISAERPATDGLAEGEGIWLLLDGDDDVWASGRALFARTFSGVEESTVPEGEATAITVQGVGLPAETPGPGDAGAADGFAWIQALPANPWVIPHSYSTVLAVVITDSTGQIVEGNLDLDGPGQVVASFAGEFSGRANVIGLL